MVRAIIVYEIGFAPHQFAACNSLFIYCNLVSLNKTLLSWIWILNLDPQLWLRPFTEEGHVYCTHARGLGDERMPLTVKLPDFYQGVERGTAVIILVLNPEDDDDVRGVCLCAVSSFILLDISQIQIPVFAVCLVKTVDLQQAS